jgi:hypothetical protein
LAIFFVLSFRPSRKELLFQLAKEIVVRSPEFKRRESVKRAHLEILKGGIEGWNDWRRENPEVRPILYDTDLTKIDFDVGLSANFSNADLRNANLTEAKLKRANFHEANLGQAKLCDADLSDANFCRTDLYKTDLSNATLNGANLQGTQLAKTNFEGAKLVDCRIYGMSAWDLKLSGATQKNLVILYKKENTRHKSQSEESHFAVDDLQVAQFVYLLLHNENIRSVIDTMTSKVVLILGRFTKDRLKVLDAIREWLKRPESGYVPILFDFDKPMTRDTHETVTTLARMARFVIADITEPRSIPQELVSIVEQMPSLPVQPILCQGFEPWGMYDHIKRYPWVLPIQKYTTRDALLRRIAEQVVKPAEKKVDEIRSDSKIKQVHGV